MSCEQVPYTQNDLRGLKKDDLATLIKGQLDKWPNGLKKFGTATTKELMSSVLLNPENGFTKAVPVSSSEGSLTPLPDTPHHDDTCGQNGTQIFPVASETVDHHLRHETESDAGSSQQVLQVEKIQVTQAHVGSAILQPESEVQLYLLIVDQRFNPIHKAAVAMTAIPFHQDRELYISSQAVVSEIQNSGIIGSGTVRLSCPFRLDSSYDEPFAINVTPNDTYTILRHQDRLFVPSDGHKLDVRMNHNVHKDFPISAEAVSLVDGVADEIVTPSASASSTGANHLPPAASHVGAHPRRQTPGDKTSIWLKEKLEHRDHYQWFVGTSGRPLQNPSIVQLWKFVGDFYAVYFNVKSAVSGSHVTKKAIAKALDVGETWLSETLAGDRLARIYGKNGPHSHRDVVEELEASCDPPYGRNALLNFLQNWEKEHPCVE